MTQSAGHPHLLRSDSGPPPVCYHYQSLQSSTDKESDNRCTPIQNL